MVTTASASPNHCIRCRHILDRDVGRRMHGSYHLQRRGAGFRLCGDRLCHSGQVLLDGHPSDGNLEYNDDGY